MRSMSSIAITKVDLSRLRKWRSSVYIRHLLYISIMWAVLCGYMWPVVFENKVLLPYDILYTIEPWRSELAGVAAEYNVQGVGNIQSMDSLLTSLPMAAVTQRAMRAGQLPLWDPNTLTGFPAGTHVAPYPPQLLALWLLRPDQALSKLVVAHLLLLSLFAYLLVTSLEAHPLAGMIAGLVAALNGMVVFHLIAPGMLPAITWMLSPFWLLVRFQRRPRWQWSVAAGLCYGMFLLTSNSQLVLYASLAYGAYTMYWMIVELWRHDFRRARAYLLHSLLMVGIGIVIGFPPLLLTYQVISEVSRGAGVASTITKPDWWIRLIVPDYWGDIPSNNQSPLVSFTTRVYIGIVPLALALVSVVFARRRAEARVLMALAIGCAAATLQLPPFSTIFNFIIPPALKLDHSRVLIMTTLLLAICAGLGADAVLRLPQARIVSASILGFLFLFSLGLFIATASLHSAASWQPDEAFRANAIGISCITSLAGIVVMLSWRDPFAHFSRIGLVAIIIADIFINFWHYQPAFPSDLIATPPLLQRLAKRVNDAHVVPARVFQVGLFGPMPQLLNYFGIPDLAGYTSLPLTRYNMYTFGSDARLDGDGYWSLVMAISKHRSRLFDALGAEYVLVPRGAALDHDTLTQLTPEIPRQTLAMSTGNVVTLNAEAIKTSYTVTYNVPDKGRSYLLTGIAMLNGSAEYSVLVNGQAIETGTVGLTNDIRYWKVLTANLTPYAGQSVRLTLQARGAPGAQWRWVDPLVHYNPDGSALLLIDAGGMLVYQNTQALPRAWLVHQATLVAPGDLQAALALVRDPRLALRDTAVLERAAPLALGAASAPEQVTITAYEPLRVAVRVRASATGLLVLPDAYQRQWRALLDGQPTELYATNLTMRGVVVPAGEHVVEFEYRQGAAWAALGVSVLALAGGLLALLAALLLALRQRARPPAPTEG